MRTRTLRSTLASLLLAGCTADFFVGPEAGGSSGMDASSSASDQSTTANDPTTGAGVTTEGTTEAPDPTLGDTTTSSSTDGGEATGPSTSSSSGSAETESLPNCNVETAKLCEAGLPTCWWTGELCMENPCDVGGELDCLAEAPDCAWEAGNCIPSGCTEEAECSPLELAVCEATKGCMVVLEQCYALACVPCGEIDNPATCQDLPNCAYDELRGACLPQ